MGYDMTQQQQFYTMQQGANGATGGYTMAGTLHFA
jgi:hypothetical protein